MVNIYEILQRAASLKEETALNSISPKRAGGIMYDTLLALNGLQQGAALVISKIYASVAAMQADTAPVSDLTGQPLRPGQIVVIASSDSDNGSVYRYNGTDAPSWSLVGTIGNLTPVDNLDSDSIILPLAAHQGKVLDGKIGQLQQEIDKKYTKPSTGIPASDIADGVIPDVSQFITRTVNDLTNYYLKSETYTKDEVAALIGAIQQFHYEVYEALPETGESNVLYLIGPTGTGADLYEEYVYSNGWVKIGDTSIDLSGYAKSVDIPVEKGVGTNSVQQKGTGAEASGASSVAEGGDNLQGGEPASGEEKLYSKAEGYASHAEGAAHAIGRYSHAEGGGNAIEEGHPTRSTAEGPYSHAEGSHTYAKGGMTHAEGNLTIAEGYGSHAEGSKTLTTGNTAHAEGMNTVAGVGDRPTISTNTEAGNYSHAEGNGTQASGNSAHSEGKHTLAEGSYSHAEGLNTRASGQNSHAEGHSQNNVSDETVVKSNDGIIEDWNDNKFTLAKGAASHAEGKDNLALGARSHAEGYQTTASGSNSHSENFSTKATGANSHAEGASCEAKGERSHVEGFHTETNNASEHAEGSYNKSNPYTRHSVGIGTGTGTTPRKNAFEIMQNGDAYLYLLGGYNGTNPGAAGVKTIKQEIDEKYIKPATGIPASDIADNVIPDVSQFITRTVNDLSNYYLKSETYTKSEVEAIIGAIQQFHYEVYASLPETGAGNVLYLIGPAGTGSDRYEEYVYANGTFTKIGDTSIDLSGYVTTQALNTALADYTKSIDIPIEKGSGLNSVKQKGSSGVIASGVQSTALGSETKAYGSYSHAEGKNSQASGIASHAEGSSQAHKNYSHSEGVSTDCYGDAGHTEGAATSVAGNYAHAEGDGGGSNEITIVSINGNVFALSSVDGLTTDSALKYDEFYYRILSINTSENTVTVDKPIVVSTWDTGTREKYGVAFGIASHVEGRHGVAFGTNAHVEGNENVADGNASHAEGYNTRTRNNNEHAEGQYNKSNLGTIHSVGIGTSESARKNAFEIMQNGDAYLKDIGGYDGTNPTGAQTIKQVIDSRESITNKTTSLSSESTYQQYPAAKTVYDFVTGTLGDIETLLAAI